MPELSTLHELVATWRREAETEKHLGGLCRIVHEAASGFTQRKLRRRHIEKEAEHEGRRLTYLNAADELERELRRMDEPDAE